MRKNSRNRRSVKRLTQEIANSIEVRRCDVEEERNERDSQKHKKETAEDYLGVHPSQEL